MELVLSQAAVVLAARGGFSFAFTQDKTKENNKRKEKSRYSSSRRATMACMGVRISWDCAHTHREREEW